MRKYELMMIINPALTAEETGDLMATVEQELADTQATIASREDLGIRDLAYKIRSSYTGRYFLFQLETPPGASFFEVTKLFNIQKDIWRFMFVKQED